MSLTLADIDRWNPEAIRAVSTALSQRGASAEDVKAGLSRLPLIESWQGAGGDAARASLDKLSKYLADHAAEMAAVAKATGAAADKIKSIKDALADLDDFAQRERFAIDRITGVVTPLDESRFDDPLYAMEQINLEAAVQKVLADARAADLELAKAITDGSGEPGIPVAGPPGGGPPMSDAQIKETVADMVAGQDLSPAEAQRLSEILNNDLRQSAANGLDADTAYANAENAAVSHMARELHRSYVRKATRLGIFEDADRTVNGDFLSDVTDSVIPAARDANGDLIWVDKLTGARVAEGAPNSMTIPERGNYHLGHEYGVENWRVLRQATEEGWTQQELNDFINHRENFRLETPAENYSHAHEDPSPFLPNPNWTPERLAEGAAAGAGAGGGTAPFISAPPNLPNVLDHPPVALPPPNSPPLQGPAIPPLAPTPALPPWLVDPGTAHAPANNPLLGPYGVNMDMPSVPGGAAAGGFEMPGLSIDLPDVTPNVSPEDAAEAGGFLAGVGAFFAAAGWVVSNLAHPFS